jgi:hypothetical protein
MTDASTVVISLGSPASNGDGAQAANVADAQKRRFKLSLPIRRISAIIMESHLKKGAEKTLEKQC